MPYTRALCTSFLLLSACATRSAAPPAAPEPPVVEAGGEYAEMLHDLRRFWLERDTVPAPVVSYQPQTHAERALRVTVAPALPEDEPWNAWPDGTARLFNDGVGYLWRVRIEADRPVRWVPERTFLAVNETDRVFSPARAADDLLLPLLQGAVVESRAGLAGDLGLRMRHADPFRQAYLETRASAGARERVLVFPAPSRELQAVAMELTIGLWVEDDGAREVRFLFE